MTRNEIIFGDCREELAAMVSRGRILGKIGCIVTDPPYGMKYVSNRAVTPEGKARNKAIKADEDIAGALKVFNEVVQISVPCWTEEFEMYVFTAWHVLDHWIPAVKAIGHGLELKQMLIWDKGYPGQGDLVGNWGCGHEIILYLKRGRRELPYRRSGIIHVDKLGAGKNIHPTEKPVELIEKLIEMSTDPEDWVMDFFSGSGSTSVAAQNLGRNSIAFENDSAYIDPSRRRLEQQGLFA